MQLFPMAYVEDISDILPVIFQYWCEYFQFKNYNINII